MADAVYTRNPIVKSAVNGTVAPTNGNRSNAILTTSATEYAMIQIGVYNGSGGASVINIGTSTSAGVAATLGNTLVYKSLTTLEFMTTVTLFIGPGITVYVGTGDTAGTTRFNYDGVILGNG